MPNGARPEVNNEIIHTYTFLIGNKLTYLAIFLFTHFMASI